MTPGQRLRAVLNVVNLSTPLGLTVGAAGRCHFTRGPRGLLLAERYRFGFPIATAFTVGNVVLTAGTWSDLLERRPTLLLHEEAHSRQWAALLGLPFLPAYVAAMGWSMLRTGDRAAANVFEVRAGLDLGGYAAVAPRPLRPAIREALRRLGGGRHRTRARHTVPA